jgi:hypothetical protein
MIFSICRTGYRLKSRFLAKIPSSGTSNQWREEIADRIDTRLARRLVIQYSQRVHTVQLLYSIMKGSTSTILLLLLDAVASFQSQPSFISCGNRRLAPSSSTESAVSQTHRENHHQQSTRLYDSINLVDNVLPGLLLVGAVGYSMMKDDDFKFPEFTSLTSSSLETKKSPSPVAPKPTPASVKQETVVAIAAVKEPAAAPAPVTAVAVVKTTPTSSRPPITPAAAPIKPVLTVVDVASTIEEQRATRELVEQKKKLAAAAAAQEVSKTETPVAETTLAATQVTEEKGTGKKRKLAMRMLKKVVAPWRKWESIA